MLNGSKISWAPNGLSLSKIAIALKIIQSLKDCIFHQFFSSKTAEWLTDLPCIGVTASFTKTKMELGAGFNGEQIMLQNLICDFETFENYQKFLKLTNKSRIAMSSKPIAHHWIPIQDQAPPKKSNIHSGVH